MTGDFNIRDDDWNPSYSYYLIHADILWEVADSITKWTAHLFVISKPWVHS